MSRAERLQAEVPEVWDSVVRRFWKYVTVPDEAACWLWTGALNDSGYGKIATCRAFGPIRATHASWALHGNHLPSGRYLLHSCDIPACVNPNHLRVGSAKENTADCIQRGRKTAPPVFQGEGHKRTNLKQPEVDAIFLDKRPDPEVAAEYGISYMTVNRIRHCRHWGSRHRQANEQVIYEGKKRSPYNGNSGSFAHAENG